MTIQTQPKLNARQQQFVLNLVGGMSQKDAALMAGYKPSRARQTASRLLATNGNIAARLHELQDTATSEKIASVVERKERLTAVARHRIETPVTAGNKVAAISELNKMEHIYEASSVVANVSVVFVIGKGYQESNGNSNAA